MAAAQAAPLPTAAMLLLLTVRMMMMMSGGTTMTRGCELADAVPATLPRRRFRRCPQSSNGGRRRPAEDEAFPCITGAAIAGAASVVLLAEPILPPAVVLVLTVLELLLWKEIVPQLQRGFHVSAAV